LNDDDSSTLRGFSYARRFMNRRASSLGDFRIIVVQICTMLLPQTLGFAACAAQPDLQSIACAFVREKQPGYHRHNVLSGQPARMCSQEPTAAISPGKLTKN
jgi:hypothetical protein